jgi:hypothetical protein
MMTQAAEAHRGFELLPLSARDKSQHLTPRATISGYEQTPTKTLARTVAARLRVTEPIANRGIK